MMKFPIVILTALACVNISFSSEIYNLPKGSIIFKDSANGATEMHIVYKLKDDLSVKGKKIENQIIFTDLNLDVESSCFRFQLNSNSSFSPTTYGKYYAFSNFQNELLNRIMSDTNSNKRVIYDDLSKFFEDPSISFTEIKLVFQALTIPFKFRSEYKDADPNPEKSLPPTVETGSSFAFSGGYKFTLGKVKTEKDFFGSYNRNLSLTLGGLVGFTTAELNSKNTTTSHSITKKQIAQSLGLFASLGYNNINIGYAIGRDYPIGDNATEWKYYDEWWHGIIVGIDIFK